MSKSLMTYKFGAACMIASIALHPTLLWAQSTLIDLANAEIRLPTVCESGATIGVYGATDLTNVLYTDLFNAAESHPNDITIVERSRIEEVLAEHELSESPYIDLNTANATDQLVGAKFLVLIEGNLSSLPTTITTQMIRVDTHEIVVDQSFSFAETDGLDALWSQLDQLAEELANTAASRNYPCPRRGTLSYSTQLKGNDWQWENSGYFDLLFRSDQVIIRHVPMTNQPTGLLLSATQPPFPFIPALQATPNNNPNDPSSTPTSYLIQFKRPSAPAPKHQLKFKEHPNPIMITGRQNELEFNHMGALALGQWMRRIGNPNLQLEAPATPDAPDSWTVPVGQGKMTLTWRLD